MKVDAIDLRTISEADARAAAELLVEVWPKPGRTIDSLTDSILQQWRDYRGAEVQHPRSFFIRDAGVLIGHANASPRTLGTRSGDLTVLALARVCTRAALRGRGLGHLLVRAAFDMVDEGFFPWALFQTNDRARGFYERMGAVRVNNHFFNSHSEDPRIWPFWDANIMRYPSGLNWPEGEIDINGPGW